MLWQWSHSCTPSLPSSWLNSQNILSQYLHVEYSKQSKQITFHGIYDYDIQHCNCICICFNEQPSLSIMLCKIGRSMSHEIGGSGYKIGRWCSVNKLRSICSIIEEPRSGSNPAPVIFAQLVNFNLFTLLTASMHCKTLSMWSSVSFTVSSFSISPKSRTSHWLPAMA